MRLRCAYPELGTAAATAAAVAAAAVVIVAAAASRALTKRSPVHR